MRPLILPLVSFFSVLSCASTAQQRAREKATYHTSQGLAVYDAKGVASRQAISDSLDNVVTWFCFRYPDRCPKMKEWAYGAILDVVAQDTPLYDPWYPQMGAMRGLTYGRNMRVWWNTTTNGADFDLILRHELAHVLLFGLPEKKGQEDHSFMKDIGYPWL